MLNRKREYSLAVCALPIVTHSPGLPGRYPTCDAGSTWFDPHLRQFLRGDRPMNKWYAARVDAASSGRRHVAAWWPTPARRARRNGPSPRPATIKNRTRPGCFERAGRPTPSRMRVEECRRLQEGESGSHQATNPDQDEDMMSASTLNTSRTNAAGRDRRPRADQFTVVTETDVDKLSGNAGAGCGAEEGVNVVSRGLLQERRHGRPARSGEGRRASRSGAQAATAGIKANVVETVQINDTPVFAWGGAGGNDNVQRAFNAAPGGGDESQFVAGDMVVTCRVSVTCAY